MTLDQLFDRAVVGELTLSPPHIVPTGTTVAQTIAGMRARRSAATVVTQADRTVGLFTEVDYVGRVLGKDVDPKSPIDAFMTSTLETVGLNTPLSRCWELMSQGNFRHLPIVDDDGRPLHLLKVRHLTQYLAERYPSEILAMAPNVHQVTEADGG